jgi:hypothetical protein
MGVGLAEDVILVPLPFADCKKLSSSAQTSTLSVQVALQSKMHTEKIPSASGPEGQGKFLLEKAANYMPKEVVGRQANWL